MLVSTKGRYALRVMLDLAEHAGNSFIPMKEVAQRQEISLKYAERILPPLAKNNFIVGMHGKGGGYKLTKAPEEYTVLAILNATEGDLAPVACLGCNPKACRNMENCKTRPMWAELYTHITAYLSSVTLLDLMQNGCEIDLSL